MYHECAAFPGANGLDELIENAAFGLSADQLDRLAHEDTPAGIRAALFNPARWDVSDRIRPR
jgi:hypothetical protein